MGYDSAVFGSWDPEKGEYRRNEQSTLLDPSPLTTRRHGMTGQDETHPYGTRVVDADVAPAQSCDGPSRDPFGHRKVNP